MKILTKYIGLAALAIVGACSPQNPEDEPAAAPAPPPAAMIAPAEEEATLNERLASLDAELRAVIETRFRDNLRVRLLRIEAATDRLLESEPPIQWLASQYDTEAKLRQLQALADRIVAKYRRDDKGIRHIQPDVQKMQQMVAELRGAVAQGAGGRRPPPLDSLLYAGTDTIGPPRAPNAAPDIGGERDRSAEQPEATAAPARPVPLGTPVDTTRTR